MNIELRDFFSGFIQKEKSDTPHLFYKGRVRGRYFCGTVRGRGRS